MGSKTSKAARPTSTKTKVVTIPRIPQEIIAEILDHLATDSDFISLQSSLQSCALVSRSWVPLCRRHLFHTIPFTLRSMARWLKAFPAPEESPARHVRHLRFSIGNYDGVAEKFFEYSSWFTNVEKVTLLVDERFQQLSMPSFWRLPPSTTSLTISGGIIALPQIQKVMAQLPNLNNLVLSGAVAPADKSALVGIGAALKGRFGGELRLLGEHASGGAVDMLLEIPTGLHFTEVRVRNTRECLLPTVRLAEACSETLVKLSYSISSHHGCEAFERSFDFSKFPNLQELDFGVGWVSEDLFWIPTALSTLKPTTSPRLSTIRLNFTHPSSNDRPVETVIKHTENDLRRIADEIARIEREFRGAVNVTIHRDPAFRAVLHALNILQH